ncbi:hypothetical protein FQN50_001602 [Emmonsiellopsis sp. PD_5]|nr:hypothetical protein FQN50_001602 [Emmonsiellopsis sp. PD_5]
MVSSLSPILRTWACASLLFTSLTTSSTTLPENEKKSANNEYDYIIVGGGLTGLVAAHRLSEDSDVSVLVLEYGIIDRSNTTQIPLMATTLNTGAMFNITSAPEPGLDNRQYSIRAGSIAGGGSSVNGMTYDRASAADYDSWEQLGNPGWGWEGLLPYFKKSADFIPPPARIEAEYNYTYDEAAYGGSSSPLKVSFPHWQVPDTYAMSDAFTEMGIPKRKEHADGRSIGQIWSPAALDPETMTRSSSLTAYYDSVKERENLKMLNEHQVIGLTFEPEPGEALVVSGVKALDRQEANKEVTFRARKEVILAAGAIHTPQILQLSGIGPKAVVEAAGIESKLDLPGVGSNFQDHPVAYLNWELENTYPQPDIMTTNETFATEALEEYLQHKTGPYTKAQSNTIAFLSLPMLTDDVESLIAILENQAPGTSLPEVYKDEETLLTGFEAQRKILTEQLRAGSVAAIEMPYSGMGQVPNSLQKPLSRGTVHLNATHPHAEPIVTHNALTNPFDRSTLYTSIQFTRRYLNTTTSLAHLHPHEVTPGADKVGQEEVLTALIAGGPLSLSPSFAHAGCSCPMMPREMGGCVGADLSVYGTVGVRVVDASVMPVIPAAHLQAGLYAVAERGLDVVRGRV